jgi:hypothetical protein
LPRLGAFSGADLLSGNHQDVMATADGVVVLGSRNLAPNPDLADFTRKHKVEHWTLKAPPRWDGWNVYARRATRIRSDGSHQPLRTTHQMKQNLTKIGFGRPFYLLDDPLINGGPVPDRSKRTDVPKPTEAPRVKVVSRSGALGYKAATWPVAIAWILGDNPRHSPRITDPSPAAFATTARGQKIEVFVGDAPEGVTGIAILMGNPGATGEPPYFVQRIVDLRRSRKDSYVLRGPFRKERRAPTTNKTFIGAFQRLPAPRWWVGEGTLGLRPMRTRLSCTYLTEQGETASQQITPWIEIEGVERTVRERKTVRVVVRAPGASVGDTVLPVHELGASLRKGTRLKFGERLAILDRDAQEGDERLDVKPLKDDIPARANATDNNGIIEVDIVEPRPGAALVWRPVDPPPGARWWRPEFLGADGSWYTMTGAGDADGYVPLSRHPRLYSHNPERWVGRGRAVSVERREVDESGIEGPDSAPEDPVVLGDIEMGPGRYRVRVNAEAKDEESGASPVSVFVLRDGGLATGGVASGVTDQVARVYRPEVQSISNERWAEKDLDDGDIDWEQPAIAGVTVSNPEDGVLRVADTSGATTTAEVKRSDLFPFKADKRYVLRVEVDTLSRTGGKVALLWRFFDAAGVQLGAAVVLLRSDEVENNEVRVTFGEPGAPVDHETPANTTQARIVFRNEGAAGDGRNLTWRARNFGLWSGRASNRKRWPLDLGLGADEDEEADRAPAAERPEEPYPDGPFCRVVENPTDGPRARNPNIFDTAGFEGAVVPAPFVVSTAGDGTVDVTEGAALNGTYGLRARKTTGSATASRASVLYPTPGATSRAVRALVRPRQTVSAGEATLLRAASDAGGSTMIADGRHTSGGDFKLYAKNGLNTDVLTVKRNWLGGQLREVELTCLNVGTANGAARLRFKHQDRPATLVEMRGLDWTGIASVESVGAGVRGAEAGANYVYHLDRVMVSRDGIGDTDPLPGNYIEYWSPDGTPYAQDNFATGLKIPVKPHQDRVFSCYAGSEGVEKTASLFKLAAKDARGRTIREYPYVVAELKGHGEWDRYHLAYKTPDTEPGEPPVAYVEVVRNNVADGYIRAGYFQDELDPGDGKPTAYTNQNALSGFFEVTLDTSVPGELPVPALGVAHDWLRMGAPTTHDFDGVDGAGTRLTDVTLSIKGADRKPALGDAPYYTNFQNYMRLVGMKRYTRMRVDLSTTDATKSPEVRGVFLDVQRALPVLLRPDGSEFDGGAFVTKWGGVTTEESVTDWKRFADSGVGWENVGRGPAPRWARGWGVKLFTLRAKQELTELQGASTDPFVVEAYGRRFEVFFFGADPGPETFDMSGARSYIAEDIEALVVDSERL